MKTFKQLNIQDIDEVTSRFQTYLENSPKQIAHDLGTSVPVVYKVLSMRNLIAKEKTTPTKEPNNDE